MTNLFVYLSIGLAVALTIIVFLILRKRKAGAVSLGLDELVTLDSNGWALMTFIAAFGAVVAIATSVSIGIDYWLGLAVDADMTAEKIKPGANFLGMFTVGTVAFFFLAIIFEFMSDLGTPMSSGLKQRGRKLIPELLFAATVGCIVMSLVTKWGYYDDKRDVRRVEAAQTSIDDGSWHTKQDEAQAIIDDLSKLPGIKVADQIEKTVVKKIETLTSQIERAERARDSIPEGHSTNRLKAQARIDALADQLLASEERSVEVAVMRENAARLKVAIIDRDEAVAKIKENAGGMNAEGDERVKAGDLLFVRILRVTLHQFLCWLFPLVALESFAAYGDTRKKEEANRKRQKTRRSNANTFDAEYEDVSPEDVRRIEAGDYYEERRADEEQELEAERSARRAGGYDDGSDDIAELDDGEDDEAQTP